MAIQQSTCVREDWVSVGFNMTVHIHQHVCMSDLHSHCGRRSICMCMQERVFMQRPHEGWQGARVDATAPVSLAHPHAGSRPCDGPKRTSASAPHNTSWVPTPCPAQCSWDSANAMLTWPQERGSQRRRSCCRATQATTRRPAVPWCIQMNSVFTWARVIALTVYLSHFKSTQLVLCRRHQSTYQQEYLTQPIFTQKHHNVHKIFPFGTQKNHNELATCIS